MKFVRIAPVFMSLFLAAGTGWAGSQTWIWRDAGGNKQYSDRPPPASVQDKDILQRPVAARTPSNVPAEASAASGAAAAAKPALKASDPELEARRRKEEDQKQAERKAEEEKLAKLKADTCRRAQEYMRNLESGMRIARTNEKGEREVLDDQARSAESEHARQIIQSECK